jgi:predicted PurR-regulated permease PerM
VWPDGNGIWCANQAPTKHADATGNSGSQGAKSRAEAGSGRRRPTRKLSTKRARGLKGRAAVVARVGIRGAPGRRRVRRGAACDSSGVSGEERRTGLVVGRVLVGLSLLFAALWLLQPFLVPTTWAAIAAYASWPLYDRVRAWTGRPRWVAALFTLLFVAVVAIPVGWVLLALAREATSVAGWIQGWVASGAPLPEWLARYPWLAERVEELRRSPILGPAAAGEWLARYGSFVSSQLVALTSGVARNVFDFSVTVAMLYVFYVDGERVAAHARRVVPLLVASGDEELVGKVGGIVRAVVFGILGTALAQGVLAGIGFAIFGVPSPVFFGFATAILSLVPAGPALLWIAAAIWLWLGGNPGAAVGLAIWGALLVSSIDNFLRPILISGPTRIPFILVFFGVLGGLATLGLLGMFVGPVLLAVAFGLAVEFPTRYGGAPGRS